MTAKTCSALKTTFKAFDSRTKLRKKKNNSPQRFSEAKVSKKHAFVIYKNENLSKLVKENMQDTITELKDYDKQTCSTILENQKFLSQQP